MITVFWNRFGEGGGSDVLEVIPQGWIWLGTCFRIEVLSGEESSIWRRSCPIVLMVFDRREKSICKSYG